MLVPFDQMPDTSRLWIYQADRKLSQEEIARIKEVTPQFLKDWTAHGNELKASFDIQHDQFLIITLDENVSQASGCSIDASVNHVRFLEQNLSISFLNNDKVAFLVDEQVELFPVVIIKQKVADNTIESNTKVFNNTVQNLGDFRSSWLVESSQTWVNRYFN